MAEPTGVLASLGTDAHALVKRAWWVFLIGGIAMVLFGLLAFVQPGIALFVLATFFAAAIMVDGVSNIVGSLQNREKQGWWIMLLIGLLGAVVGAYALFNPPISIMAFIFLIAFEAILLGIFLLMLGYKVREATNKEWLLYLTGALSILFGILVIARPVAGGVSIVYMIAAWSLLIGTLKIVFAFKVKNAKEAVSSRIAASR